MTASQFYELRLYQVERGRIHDMIDRRRGALRTLFQRHGIAPLGNWYTASGPDSHLFVYLMRWPDWNTRQNAWAGFYSDPEWKAARESTNAGSELVERYELNLLKEIHPWVEQHDAALNTFELHISNIDIGRNVAAGTMIREEMSHKPDSWGGQLLGAFEYLTGNDLPRAALFLGWQGNATLESAHPLLEQAPFNSTDRYLLKPISL